MKQNTNGECMIMGRCRFYRLRRLEPPGRISPRSCS